MTAQCPECDGTITLAADVLDGEIVPCQDCGADLEVVLLDVHVGDEAVAGVGEPLDALEGAGVGRIRGKLDRHQVRSDEDLAGTIDQDGQSGVNA